MIEFSYPHSHFSWSSVWTHGGVRWQTCLQCEMRRPLVGGWMTAEKQKLLGDTENET